MSALCLKLHYLYNRLLLFQSYNSFFLELSTPFSVLHDRNNFSVCESSMYSVHKNGYKLTIFILRRNNIFIIQSVTQTYHPSGFKKYDTT